MTFLIWLCLGFFIVPGLMILAALLGGSGSAWIGGMLAGLIVWFFVGFWMLLGTAYDGCDSLDPDNMCVETSEGTVRV